MDRLREFRKTFQIVYLYFLYFIKKITRECLGFIITNPQKIKKGEKQLSYDKEKRGYIQNME